jgi:hypothetical protein
MPRKRQDVRELKEKWEAILRAEGMPSKLRYDSPYDSGTVSHDITTIEAKTRYYQLMGHKVETYEFKDAVEAVILRMHSNGSRNFEIVAALEAQGTPCSRKIITHIIRRYETLWRVRRWEPGQMYTTKSKKAPVR